MTTTPIPMHVVLAADDIFAMQLTAAASSVLEHADEPQHIHLTIIDCGMSSRNRRRIRRSLDGRCSSVELVRFRHEIPRSALQGGVIPSTATFARLFAADYATSADVAIYLDSDTVAQVDLRPLTTILAPTALVGGIPDGQGDGWVRNIDRLRTLIDDESSSSPYINAGVLVMNLAAWRAEHLSERFADLIASTPLRFADQDAINVICAGRIQVLPTRWNAQTHLLDPSTSVLRSSEDAFGARDAAVVHYTSRPKPWHLHGDVDLARPWFDAVDHTDWRGWRPTQRRLLVPKLRRGWRMLRTRPAQLIAKYRPGSRRSVG